MASTEVLIVGGGAAGVAAALAAAQRGARVTLVRAAPGATALSSGGWRGSLPAPFASALAAVGYTLHAAPAPLPHPDGRLIAFDFATAAHAAAGVPAGALSAATQDATLVCGIAGLPGFRARALATLWADAAGLPAKSFQHASVTVPDTPPAGWAPASLAAAVAREPERLGSDLGMLARQRQADRVIVPAVLGLDAHERVYATVAEAAATAAGRPLVIGESLGAAPAVPGWRLDQALLRAVAAARVTVVHGRVAAAPAGRGAAVGQRTVDRVIVRGPGGAERTISCTAIVLATGKYIGGGITAGPEFAESALGLPVTVHAMGGTYYGADESLALTTAARGSAQPLLLAGVSTGAGGGSAGADGGSAGADGLVLAANDGVAGNVFIAGTVRDGTGTAECGVGDAVADGWRAGLRAAELAARE